MPAGMANIMRHLRYRIKEIFHEKSYQIFQDILKNSGGYFIEYFMKYFQDILAGL